MKLSNKPLQVGATGIMIASALSGCNSETQSYKKPVELATATPHVEVKTSQEVAQPIIEIPVTPLTPSIPVVEEPVVSEPVIAQPQPQPQTPTMPIFIGESITTHTQQPYSGTIAKGGDVYLRYNQTATTMDKFELPEWEVTYRYEPMIEVLITNGSETICARYSWKKGGFGYAKPFCLWSDTRQAVPLEGMKSAYYDYSIVESRVWANGVVVLWVGVE